MMLIRFGCLHIIMILGGFTSLIYGQLTDQHFVDVALSEFLLMDVEPNSATIDLSLEMPDFAGDPVSTVGDNSKWINYTVCLAPFSPLKSITAQIISENIPSGLSLLLQASGYSGIGEGMLGGTTGQINLSSTAQTIISGIGGSFTGDGPSNGHKLTYTMNIAEYDEIKSSQNTMIQVIFTLKDL